VHDERQSRPLSATTKSVYALGDFTVNTVLVSLSMIFATYYLLEVIGMRPALAGLVPLIGRTVDAITDPAMGRLSDVTRWRWGRRRPYFLIGAVPFGLTFALLWSAPPLASQWGLFAYYAVLYSLLSIFTTVLSVPYLALLPEMALDYDERTSLNTYRNAASVLGIAAAIGMRPLANLFGGGVDGFAAAGAIVGVIMVLPWLAVHRVSFERPNFQLRSVDLGVVEGLKVVVRHQTFRVLMALYLCGRIAMDLMGAMLIIYMTRWIGRSGFFEPMMLLFLASVVLSLPFWLHLSRNTDKATIFTVGSLWWMASLLLLLVAQPGWPTWTMLIFAPWAGMGFAVVDLMPWAMIGDVIDEDDLATGERREGLYNGVFTFLRKLGGAVAVWLALLALDVVGLAEPGHDSQATLWTIRLLASVVPAVFLAAAVWFARDYRLTRDEHARILATLRAREGRG